MNPILQPALNLLLLIVMVPVPLWAADTVPTTPKSEATDGSNGVTGSRTVKGDVLYVEGEYVVIKDLSGHEMRLHVDQQTRMDRLKTGDKVAAIVTPEGHAQSVTVQLPQSQ